LPKRYPELEKDVAISIFARLGCTSATHPEFPNELVFKCSEGQLAVPLHWGSRRLSPLNIKRIVETFQLEDQFWREYEAPE
jgi:hypothetical protein